MQVFALRHPIISNTKIEMVKTIAAITHASVALCFTTVCPKAVVLVGKLNDVYPVDIILVTKKNKIDNYSNMIFDATIKISVFGDSCNGKTTLIRRFVNETFDEDLTSTIGIDCKVKVMEIENKKIKVFIWDTAGQEKYSQITSTCYRNVDGIIITYDTTNFNSFLNLDKWIERAKDMVDLDKIEVIIIGTKSDLIEERQVPIDYVIDFVKKHETKYLETSSKDNINVDIVFNVFIEAVYKKMSNGENKIPKKIVKLNRQVLSDNSYTFNCCNY
jgi:small GTP-binding protein